MQGDIVETIIAINLQNAKAQFDADTDLRKEFGRGYVLQLKGFQTKTLWTPPSIVNLMDALRQRELQQGASNHRKDSKQCFFGHPDAKSHKKQDQVPL